MRIENFQPKGVQTPRSVDGNIPANHFIGVLYSSKGTGKTNMTINLVKQYDKTHHFQKVYLFSPSYDSDPKYEHLKDGSYELHVYHDFTNDLFERVVDEIKRDLEIWREYERTKKLWDKAQRAKSLKKFTEEELFELYNIGWEEPIAPFEAEPWSLIIYDDLASNPYLMKQGRCPANQFALRTRHFRTSILYAVQQYRGCVPTMIRKNLDLWVLAPSKSDKDMSAVAEELTSYASERELMDMWSRATAEPYNYFVVNLMSKPDLRFTKNFDEPLSTSSKPIVKNE